MQRVSRASAVAGLPAPPTPGTPGYFGPGDPGSGTPATTVGYEWFNSVQEEIVAAILDTGVALDGATLTQLRQSIRRAAAANITTLSANTPLTVDHAGLLLLSASGGTRTFTLPAAAAAGGAPVRLVMVRTDAASANTMNIVAQGSDTLNGLTGGCPLPVGASVALVGDGVSAWHLVSSRGLKSIAVFTATGTATAPWWARRALVEVVGGGGGGGGTGTAGTGGGGGGGGGYARGIYHVTPGGSTAVTIGAGGSGTSSTGNNAGATSFGSLLAATGGQGGGPFAVNSAGGPGGTGSGGQINLAGSYGGDGAGTTSGANPYAGYGGSPGGIGGGSGRGGSGTGVAATSYGAGGGGAYTPTSVAASGGNGFAGVCIVEWLP